MLDKEEVRKNLVVALRNLNEHPKTCDVDQLTKIATIPGIPSGDDDVDTVLLKSVPFLGVRIHCGGACRRWLSVCLATCAFEVAMERFFPERVCKTGVRKRLRKLFEEDSPVKTYVNQVRDI